MRTTPFTKIYIPANDRDCLKTAIFYKKNEVIAYVAFIQWDEINTQIVHFVAGNNGDEYGQFVKMDDAIKKAQLMASLSFDERRKYDE